MWSRVWTRPCHRNPPQHSPAWEAMPWSPMRDLGRRAAGRNVWPFPLPVGSLEDKKPKLPEDVL